MLGNPQGLSRAFHYCNVVARLKPGVNIERAQAAMNVIAASLEAQYPEEKNWRIQLKQLQEDLVGRTRPVLLILAGVVGLVLLIACVSAGNLLLTRAVIALVLRAHRHLRRDVLRCYSPSARDRHSNCRWGTANGHTVTPARTGSPTYGVGDSGRYPGSICIGTCADGHAVSSECLRSGYLWSNRCAGVDRGDNGSCNTCEKSVEYRSNERAPARMIVRVRG